MSESKISLRCFFQGIETEFTVSVYEEGTVGDIREAIRLEKILFIRRNNISINEYKMWKVSVPTDDIAGLKRVPAEIEVYTEMDVEQGIRPTFGDDLINNRDNIQVFMGKSVTMGMENGMKKIVEMALTENKAQVKEQLDEIVTENKAQVKEQLDEIENKIQNLTKIVESKKTRNPHQLSGLCSMGIRVNDKLVFEKKYQHILHVKREFRVTAINFVQDENNNRKWRPSVESIDDDEDKPHIEWNGDNLSELEKKIIVTDAKPRLIILYNQAIDDSDEKYLGKVSEMIENYLR